MSDGNAEEARRWFGYRVLRLMVDRLVDEYSEHILHHLSEPPSSHDRTDASLILAWRHRGEPQLYGCPGTIVCPWGEWHAMAPVGTGRPGLPSWITCTAVQKWPGADYYRIEYIRSDVGTIAVPVDGWPTAASPWSPDQAAEWVSFTERWDALPAWRRDFDTLFSTLLDEQSSSEARLLRPLEDDPYEESRHWFSRCHEVMRDAETAFKNEPNYEGYAIGPPVDTDCPPNTRGIIILVRSAMPEFVAPVEILIERLLEPKGVSAWVVPSIDRERGNPLFLPDQPKRPSEKPMQLE